MRRIEQYILWPKSRDMEAFYSKLDACRKCRVKDENETMPFSPEYVHEVHRVRTVNHTVYQQVVHSLHTRVPRCLTTSTSSTDLPKLLSLAAPLHVDGKHCRVPTFALFRGGAFLAEKL